MSASQRRQDWVEGLLVMEGVFPDMSSDVASLLRSEIVDEGAVALVDHLRFCGAVPESYEHDSTAEKLYSKYTDHILNFALERIGLKSVVLSERADSADVQARGANFSLVADAKAFRLSRSAKNQKDFKVEAMHYWRAGLDFALLVCPIYQLPGRASQIYRQAVSRNVCIISYCHLSTLVRLSELRGTAASEQALHQVLRCVTMLHPSKDSSSYWTGINRALLDSLRADSSLWTDEKVKSIESLSVLKLESLRILRQERHRLLGLNHAEALEELVKMSGLDSRIRYVEQVEHGDLLDAG
ncbi:HindIII family type II restriction endonuclease [bacterium]|nr:HindIII family type II restriction endonuclease [bacterium]